MQIKKITSLVLAAALSISLAACGNSQTTAVTSGQDTFFDTYDFSGTTIIPFNTHAGSRDGGTYGDIKELEPNATVLDGLAVRGEDAGKDSTKEAVLSWLEGLDLE